ncbi:MULTISPECIES: SUKH-3 domain-containing protein [Deinococcus]|uniref:SUKH-3 domain-containing protein n=1 Tax=Deinococcus rufus TaxID=2136097 RepID=A0ABV7ZEQ5_9DEIO|nr:SUKH-3 domain-containing protein [Deinococcus sp. AB2017081]WQE94243.1 SUKH-3 domain-containing protein [Deinococcus sp. AB2017081]
MSDLPFEITDELRTQLLAIGWSEDRRVDISADVALAEKNGWQIFPLARAVLEQFDGLGLRNNIQFNLNDVGTSWTYDIQTDGDPNFPEFERSHQQKLYPLAVEDAWSPLFITDSGLIVQFTDDEPHWRGLTPQKDFEDLFGQMYIYRSNKEHL